jgi:glutaconate CoA-transferase subunit A
MDVAGVIESPGGAHFTECPPDYGRDEAFQRRYVAASADDEAWEDFRREFLELDEAGYRTKVAELAGADGGAR